MNEFHRHLSVFDNMSAMISFFRHFDLSLGEKHQNVTNNVDEGCYFQVS